MSRTRKYNEAGAQAIEIGEILAYMDACYITDYMERERILRFIAAMDEVFLEHLRKKQQKT